MKPATREALRLLQARGADGLTSAEAHQSRLAARVHELRKAGYRIEDTRERAEDGALYARYYLVGPVRPRVITGTQAEMGL